MDPVLEQDNVVEANLAEQKQRHGCLTVALGMMIVYGSIGLSIGLFFGLSFWLFGDWYRQYLPMLYSLLRFFDRNYIILYFVPYTLYVLCAIALFKWKKWGFWVFIGTALAPGIYTLVTDSFSPFTVIQLSFAALPIALLFGVLHIGKENKGWPQLD